MKRVIIAGLLIIFSTYFTVSADEPISLEEFKNITKSAYQSRVYVEYLNGTPYFYLDIPKDYEYKPVVVCALIYKDLVESLGFKTNCSKYDVVITDRDVKGKAIIFYDEEGELKKLIWLKNPLNISPIYVKGVEVEKSGEIIAVYSEGGNAVVRNGDKIYVGFKPNNATLANLLALYSIKKTEPPTLPITSIAVISLATAFVLLIRFFDRMLYKIIGILSFLLITIGYSRLSGDQILLNDTRRKIYEYILDNPYSHLRKIVKDFEISISTATWHLRILERAGLIKKEKMGNKIVYYPAGMVKDDLVIVATLNNDTATAILKYLIKKGETHLRKIANDLDMNIETVRYNLKKLEDFGIILSAEKGNRIVYYVNPEISKNLSDFKEI